jgi:hypothetical protein
MIYGEDEFNDVLVNIIKSDYRHPLYAECVRLEREMSVHIYGHKPVELLGRVRPGEDEEIKKYRLDNYEATTKAPAGKAIKIISKIFNPNLMSIIFPPDNQSAKKLQEYTTFYYPVYNSLIAYNKDVTLKKMIADANGLMAVKPQRIPQNDAERLKPIVVIYGSEKIWNWDLDHYLINIGVEDNPKGRFYTFEYYDRTRWMKFTAHMEGSEKLIIDEDEIYPTNFVNKEGEAEIPAWRLRGNSIACDDGDIMFESFFADAKPNWNLAVIHESDVLGAYVKHMNPQRVIVGEECSHEKLVEGINYRCTHGMLLGIDRHKPGSPPLSYGTCDACDGKGKISSSPYDDHVVLKQKFDEEGIKVDPVSYVNVPIDATKMLQERSKEMVRAGSWAINMDVEDEVGAVQSGTAKSIDRSAQSDTIYDIGAVMYDVHMQNQYYFINKYMNAINDTSAGKDADKNLPQINKPNRFNIETIAELVGNFKNGKDSGLDRNFLQAKMVEILNKDLDTNPELKKYYTVIINLDPLFGLTTDDIDSQLMKGTIKKTDVAIHFNLKPFADQALAADKNFLEKKKEEQLKVLQKYAEELVKSEQPEITLNDPEPAFPGA